MRNETHDQDRDDSPGSQDSREYGIRTVLHPRSINSKGSE
jgi:hypothetical protein